MVRIGDEYGGEAVESEDAVGFRILDGGEALLGLQLLVVRVPVGEGPGCLAAEDDLVDAHQEAAGVEALRHPWLEVARAVQLLVQPAPAEGLGVGGELVAFAAGREGVEGR